MGQAGLAEVGSRGPLGDSAARSGSRDGIPECQMSEGRCVCVCLHREVSKTTVVATAVNQFK